MATLRFCEPLSPFKNNLEDDILYYLTNAKEQAETNDSKNLKPKLKLIDNGIVKTLLVVLEEMNLLLLLSLIMRKKLKGFVVMLDRL